MQPTVMNYTAKKGETLEQALWSAGVYRKKDTRSFKEVAEGKPAAVYTLYDSTYLVNGCCHNCHRTGTHYAGCPGTHMNTIKNIVMPVCPLCNYSMLKGGEKWCHDCEMDVLYDCGCYSPGYCDCLEDEDFCTQKKEEWKEKLAGAGIETN
jgi:hypothetical protein